MCFAVIFMQTVQINVLSKEMHHPMQMKTDHKSNVNTLIPKRNRFLPHILYQQNLAFMKYLLPIRMHYTIITLYHKA